MSIQIGTLFVVATPIGNLEDLTPRAKRILGEVDLIAAEDTRETLKLFGLVGIKPKKIMSYHDHNEAVRSQELLQPLLDGQSIALVSDAGTPGVSDPGYRLVALAHQHKIPVVPIPGASALTSLISVAGLPTNRFMFVGFLPTKTQARNQEISQWGDLAQGHGMSIIFYESTRRLGKTLSALGSIHPNCQVAIGRELTKFHEEIFTASVHEAILWFSAHTTLKGEVAVMVAITPKRTQDIASDPQMMESLIRKAQSEFIEGASLKSLLQKYRDIGLKRSELYGVLLQAKGEKTYKK